MLGNLHTNVSDDPVEVVVERKERKKERKKGTEAIINTRKVLLR